MKHKDLKVHFRVGKGLELLKFGIEGKKKKQEKVQTPVRRQKFSSVSHQRVLFNNGGFTLAENLNAEECGDSLVQITAPYHSECPTCFALCTFCYRWEFKDEH